MVSTEEDEGEEEDESVRVWVAVDMISGRRSGRRVARG